MTEEQEVSKEISTSKDNDGKLANEVKDDRPTADPSEQSSNPTQRSRDKFKNVRSIVA